MESCSVATYGLQGDRCCAFYDEAKTGWASFITAREIPEMLTYKATFVDEEVNITSHDGRDFNWNEDLLNEIQKYSKRKVSMMAYKASNPENPELLAVDLASVLIITDVTLRKLEELCGNKLDERRFRANVMIAVEEHSLNESQWIGKQLRIGNAEFQIDSNCERCSIITLDPDTLERDSSLLRKVNEEMNLSFGVYASIKKTGQIHVGDKVYLLD